MKEKILIASYGSKDNPLRIVDIEIPCFVLEDGTRVITQFGFYRAIGRSGKPAKGWGSQFENIAPFLDLDNLKPYISNDLIQESAPIPFRIGSGTKAWGFRAELLPKVCDVYIEAHNDGVLLKSQQKFALACRAIKNALAQVGIIALVDEATGYQTARKKNELQQILAMYVRAEFLPWIRTFPEEFYKQMFRLRELEYDPSSLKRPWIFAKDTIEIIYKRFPIGVYENLVRLNPKDSNGNRKKKLFQFLTSEIGRPHLEKHLTAVMAIQRISPNWLRFMGHIERAFPKNDQLSFDLDDEIFILPEEERHLKIKKPS